jgi:hypothetical protein
MSDSHGTVREVVWGDLCPWLILPRAVRIAMSPRVLLLAAAALLAVTAGWRGIGLALSQSSNPLVQASNPLVERALAEYGTWPWELVARDTQSTNADRVGSVWEAIDATLQSVPLIGEWLSVGPVTTVWRRMSDPFVRLFHCQRQEFGVVGLAYLLLCCLWTILIWALFGGAITRIAALALARDERLGPQRAIRFAASKCRDFISAPLLPLLGVVLIMIPLALLGLGMRYDVLVFVAGLLWPLVLLAGFLLAIILLGLLAGWPLLWPAISVERGDSFDAVSNCYAYVYQRPLHYVFYLFIASLVGVVGALAVNVFAGVLLDLSAWAVSWGCGTERLQLVLGADLGAQPTWTLSSGATLIRFWAGCVFTAQLAFYYGFFWTAATAIYLLLRRAVDAKEMDEVALDDEADVSGLAPLADGETGVPR